MKFILLPNMMVFTKERRRIDRIAYKKSIEKNVKKSLFFSQLNNTGFHCISLHFFFFFCCWAARSSKMVFKLMGFKVVYAISLWKWVYESMSVKRELNYLHLILDITKKKLQMDWCKIFNPFYSPNTTSNRVEEFFQRKYCYSLKLKYIFIFDQFWLFVGYLIYY